MYWASLSPLAQKNLIKEAVNSAMRSGPNAPARLRGYSLRERVGTACWQLEQQLCVDLLGQWLGHERERVRRFASWRWSKTKHCRWRACRSPCALIESMNLKMAAERSSTIKLGHPRGPTGWGSVHNNQQLPLYSLLDHKIQGIAFAELSASDSGSVHRIG